MRPHKCGGVLASCNEQQFGATNYAIELIDEFEVCSTVAPFSLKSKE
jgi:hypothetical protein